MLSRPAQPSRSLQAAVVRIYTVFFSFLIPSETVGDVFRSIAAKLQISEYRFDDRFTLQFEDRSLHAAEHVQACGMKSGSRLLLLPRITTGLKGSPSTKREIKKAIESMVDRALQNGDLKDGPVTLVTKVGHQQVAVHLAPMRARSRSKSEASEGEPADPAAAEQEFRKKIALATDALKMEEKKKKQHEAESEVCPVYLPVHANTFTGPEEETRHPSPEDEAEKESVRFF
jgi:hypothetical protein